MAPTCILEGNHVVASVIGSRGSCMSQGLWSTASSDFEPGVWFLAITPFGMVGQWRPNVCSDHVLAFEHMNVRTQFKESLSCLVIFRVYKKLKAIGGEYVFQV